VIIWKECKKKNSRPNLRNYPGYLLKDGGKPP